MAEPQRPEPDDKDWTWTITRPCPDCGFDPGAVALTDVPARTRAYVGVLVDAVARTDAARRPSPLVWSPLEYGAHVRDVCALFRRRLRLMLTEPDPLFDNWDQDETALSGRYWEQDPGAVAVELQANAAAIADDFAAVTGAQWARPGRRSNGSTFTVDTFARYFLHDLAHHADDVGHRDASGRNG
jgi:hypothetical protein